MMGITPEEGGCDHMIATNELTFQDQEVWIQPKQATL